MAKMKDEKKKKEDEIGKSYKNTKGWLIKVRGEEDGDVCIQIPPHQGEAWIGNLFRD